MGSPFEDPMDATQSDDAAAYQWAWLVLPTPWLQGQSDSSSTFPLPVACLSSGRGHMINAIAMWQDVPGIGLVGEFFKPWAAVWRLTDPLGMDRDQHLAHSNQAKA